MSNDYAMTMIDRMIARGARGAGPSEPIDPTRRAMVDRLVDEIRAIDTGQRGRQQRH
ncbi:hypothetical protein [Sphingomonas abietis]|uniref:Uncharacterized protein n=1 Tax=Sphingomonas abietis TaxID=3012344 RepID=A0ABY7NLF8_9SPHN|nr:hypothetical protein [Sphingomonas abietis]WBO22188.1 hypothetical protein PBT88_18875 [Sphingomonas abietis]